MGRKLAIGLVIVVVIGAGLYFSGAQVKLKIGRENGNVTGTLHDRKSDRTVTVDGVGEVAVYPDRARITISIKSIGSNAARAIEVHNSKIARISKGLQGLGVGPRDIRTSKFKLRRKKGSRSRQSVGESESFEVEIDNSISVDTDKVNQVGNILDQAIEWGAADVGNLTFHASDKGKYEAMARELAVEHARMKASNLVGASGHRLGNVSLIYDTGTRRGNGGKNSVSLLEAGEDYPIFINPVYAVASVKVSFEIK